MKEKLALFFDGANHSKALIESKVSMDYKKFLRGLNKNYSVVSARYYSGISDEPEYQSVKDFLNGLAKNGYVLVTKPIRKYPDGTIKGNVDIEIAVDMLMMAPRIDKVMLFSGDGDFTYLVDTVQRMGVCVSVCGHKHLTSTDLRIQCNEFLDLRSVVNYQE